VCRCFCGKQFATFEHLFAALPLAVPAVQRRATCGKNLSQIWQIILPGAMSCFLTNGGCSVTVLRTKRKREILLRFVSFIRKQFSKTCRLVRLLHIV